MRKLDDEQCRYTPDAGDEAGDVACGVCGEKMDVKRDCFGPRTYCEAMSFHHGNFEGTAYDHFECPHIKESWHRQVIALRKEARSTSSKRNGDMLNEEADAVLASRTATVIVSPFSHF